VSCGETNSLKKCFSEAASPCTPEDLKATRKRSWKSQPPGSVDESCFIHPSQKVRIVDVLAEHLGLKFQGGAFGIIEASVPDAIIENLETIGYVAGSAILESDLNSGIEVLGPLGPDDCVDLNSNDIKDLLSTQPYLLSR
jgi:hypothetical protein